MAYNNPWNTNGTYTGFMPNTTSGGASYTYSGFQPNTATPLPQQQSNNGGLMTIFVQSEEEPVIIPWRRALCSSPLFEESI